MATLASGSLLRLSVSRPARFWSMFEFADAQPNVAAAAGPSAGGPGASWTFDRLLSAARRHWRVVTVGAVIGAALGAVAVKVLPTRYVATTQIYIDPNGSPGAEAQNAPPGQDSNGFIAYVESQALIAGSQSVLEKVVVDQKLDHDPEFSGAAFRSILASLWPTANHAPDPVAEAARALAAHISIRRPERTFVLDLSVTSRDPDRAAALANAAAQAYIDALAETQSETARKTEAELQRKLGDLRDAVERAEKKVEEYKASNNLIGTREALPDEQQLKSMNDELVAARARMAEAKARADQIEALRTRGGDVGAVATQLVLPSLGALRAQQAEARQRVADLSRTLGPRHPQLLAAEAQVAAADAAVDAELRRFADSQRIDYARAKALETSLTGQLDDLKRRNELDSQRSVGLRELEREADAAREVYDLFVQRSRASGDIQQISPTRTRVISEAIAPTTRSFPPPVSTMMGAGALAGLLTALFIAFRLQSLPASAGGSSRERNIEPLSAREPITPAASEDRVFSTTSGASGSELRIVLGRESDVARQSVESLSLARLGFPATAEGGFGPILGDVLRDLAAKPRYCVFFVGDNRNGFRTACAIALALAAAKQELRVRLIDGARRNARLTRAVRASIGDASLLGRDFLVTIEHVSLVLPKLGVSLQDEPSARGEAELDRHLEIYDGPEPIESDALRLLLAADAVYPVVAADDPASAQALKLQLAAAGIASVRVIRCDRVGAERLRAA